MDAERIHQACCWGEDSDAQSSLTGEKISGEAPKRFAAFLLPQIPFGQTLKTLSPHRARWAIRALPLTLIRAGLMQKWGAVRLKDGGTKAEEYKKQKWIKVHLMCGVKTNVVTSAIVTDKYAGDCPRFKPLVNATAENFVINQVSADKAYSSRPNLKLITSKAATPFIDFKDNAKANPKDSVWTRLPLIRVKSFVKP